MLKNIKSFFIASVVVFAVNPLFAVEIYAVKPNDYLFKIAKLYSIKGVSRFELISAIKGINKSEILGIIDNKIKVGDKLIIPTTENEVKDGLALIRSQILQHPYNQPESSNILNDKDINNISSNDSIDQENIPNLIPEGGAPITYKNNLSSRINADHFQQIKSSNKNKEEKGAVASLTRFVLIFLVLAGLIFATKKIWKNRNDKKEQELEFISRKKRSHLISRISPVVSGSDSYKSSEDLQKEFSFSSSSGEESLSSTKCDEINIKEGESCYPNLGDDSFNEVDKNIPARAANSVIFETNVNNKLVNATKNNVEETGTQDNVQQELAYIEELVDQYLESEKYVEASITVQDSLEKDPNNADLRYKLLEVYARAGDGISFEGEVHLIKSKNIVSMFDPLHQKIMKLRDKYFE